MNPFRIFDIFRRGHAFVDAVKSGKQAAIVAALGALLAIVAPFLGSQLNAHPWLAYFFSEAGIQAIGAVITGVAGLAYHFGSSPDRGVLPAKSTGPGDTPVRTDADPAPAADAPVAQPAERSAPVAVQPVPDALSRQDDESMRAGG